MSNLSAVPGAAFADDSAGSPISDGGKMTSPPKTRNSALLADAPAIRRLSVTRPAPSSARRWALAQADSSARRASRSATPPEARGLRLIVSALGAHRAWAGDSLSACAAAPAPAAPA